MADAALRKGVRAVRERAVRLRDAMDRPADRIARSPQEEWIAATGRFLKILFLEVRENAIWQRASTLTYTTILSLFPLLVLLTALGSAFYDETRQEQLIAAVQNRLMPPLDAGILTPQGVEDVKERREEIQRFVTELRDRANRFRASAGSIGAAGFLGLLVTGFMLYHSIETSFEKSWETGIKKPLWRTLAGFAVLILFAPVILGISLTASSYLVAKLDGAPPAVVEQGVAPETIADSEETVSETRTNAVARFALSLANPLFNGFMLALAYTYIPQAKVRFRYAIVGGVFAGVSWEAAKAVFFYYIMTSATQRSVIQSLGAVPFFLIWIYFTWIVFLAGNELTCVMQNYGRMVAKHLYAKSVRLVDGRVYVVAMLMVAEAFVRGEGGVARETLGRMLRMAPKAFDEMLSEMLRRGWMAEAENNRLLLAMPAERIPLKEILSAGCDPGQLCDARSLAPEARALASRLRIDTGGLETLADLLAKGSSGATSAAT